ncbi:MAG: hypothetical protein V3T93_06630 [Alphaproteobacteria bacterium]
MGEGMVVGRVLGWLLILVAVLAFGAEVDSLVTTGGYHVKAAGEWWFEIDRASLNLSQAVIQRYVHPFLWDPVIQTVLRTPAWAVAGVPGAALVWFCRKGKRRRRKSIFTRPPRP